MKFGTLPAKTTPVDADGVLIVDSANSNKGSYTLWSNIKATLKTYFDTLYHIVGGTDIPIADGGTGASSAATAFDNLKQAASETATGVVERLTDAEFTTGTDTTRYPNAAQVKGVAQVVTNKRNQKRFSSATSNATLTPEIDTADIWIRTAQAAALTIANHSTSTPAEGEMILIKIKDSGTARAITYGTNYIDMETVRPTTTVVSKWLFILFIWSATDSKFHCVDKRQQA